MLSLTVPPCVLDESKLTILNEIKETRKVKESMPKFKVGNLLFRRDIRAPDASILKSFDQHALQEE